METGHQNALNRQPTANAQSAGLVCASLVQDIVEGITSGALKRNERLPSEQELSRKYGISVTAVRRGMEILVREGFLSRRRGSGTYVMGEAPAVSPVRASTILICRGVIHAPSHPYFGHIYPRLISRLAELGLGTAGFEGETSGYDATHTEYPQIDPGQFAAFLNARTDLAGAVLHRVNDAIEACVKAARLPCVTIGKHDDLPYVDYDWDAEFARAIGLALRFGAKRVWALGSVPASEDAACVRMATAMVSDGRPESVTIHRNPRSAIYSQTTYDACEATRAMLRDCPGVFDGIAIASDFHAQGVMDALAEAGVAPERCPIIVSLVNKESRIHTRLPFTALVSDGAALGAAAADLLCRQIKEPNHAPKSMILGCVIESAR